MGGGHDVMVYNMEDENSTNGLAAEAPKQPTNCERYPTWENHSLPKSMMASCGLPGVSSTCVRGTSLTKLWMLPNLHNGTC